MNNTRSRFQSIGLTLGAAGFALGMTAAAQAAVVITTADGSGADTYLTNDSNSGPTAAHGTENGLEFRHWVDVRTRIPYIRFDLSNVTGDLSGATITINVTSDNRGRQLTYFGVVDGATGGQGENWDESTLSYSDAAGFTAATGTYATTADLTGELARTGGISLGQQTTTVNINLDNFLAADTNGLVTFAIFEDPNNGSEDTFFTAKEAGNGLQAFLTLPNATLVPEPASLALMGLGGLLLINRRRSRA